MRAIRRANIFSAAIRAAPSSWSHAVDGKPAGSGLGGAGGSGMAKFSCTAALLVSCRLTLPALESVDDLAQGQQITETAERDVVNGVIPRGAVGKRLAPVGPRGRNKRAAAVWQDKENEQLTAAPDATDHCEGLTLEGVSLADNRDLGRNIAEMGSLTWVPSTRSRTTSCGRSSTGE
jgi:hypothetical protein